MGPAVLITGASSGIGAATARLLLASGFEVFGTSRRPEALPRDAPAIRWIAMDVCDDASVRAGLQEVHTAAPQLDALVVNAGWGVFGSVEEVSLDAARAQFETNFFGALRVLRAVLPAMREAGRGRIAVVGSLAGRAPIPFQAHYSASKAALDALSLALHNELHPHGVSVSLIEPGDVRTDFNDSLDWGDSQHSPYGARIQRCEQVVRDSLPEAPPAEGVARVIHRALTSRRPRVRYTAGADRWLVPLGRRLLPDWLSLRLIRSHFGI